MITCITLRCLICAVENSFFCLGHFVIHIKQSIFSRWSPVLYFWVKVLTNFLKGSNYNKLNQKNNYLNKCISEKINHNQLIFKNSQYVYFWWENWKMVGKNSLLFNRFLIKKIEVFLTQKQYNLKSMKNDIKQLFFEINIVFYLLIY